MGVGEFLWGLAETSIDFFPVGSNSARKALGLLKRGIGAAKDLQSGLDIGSLSTDIGNLKGNLNNVKNEMEAQGKALQGAIDGVKSELEGQLKQQGDKLAEEINQLENKLDQESQERKKELQKQKEQLESQIQEVIEKFSQAQRKLKQELEDFKAEVDERFAHAERKIAENKRKIEEERIKREEEIRDANSKIKLTNTNLENLREEKEELANDFAKYQSTINQQTADTQQAFSDLEADYQHNKNVLDARIRTQEEVLEEQEEELSEVRQEQQQIRQDIYNITEDLETQADLIFQSQRKLDLVANQMEEIAEETHEKLNLVEAKVENVLSVAKKTTRQVNKLSEELEAERKRIKELEAQITQNKYELDQVKEQAEVTNERLDWLIKDRQLTLDSEIAFNKLQKSITLKANESKLLAQINLLNHTKDLLSEKEAENEREWKVGIQTGTERNLDRAEGMPLVPNSQWEKIFGIEQLREWGWDVRLENKENETAPLTTPNLRKEEKPKNSTQSSVENQDQEKSNQALRKQIEDTKEKLLEQLREIQEQINKTLPEEELSESTPLSTKQKDLEEQLTIAYQKKQGEIPLESRETEQGLNSHIENLEQELAEIANKDNLQENQTQINQINHELLTQQWEQVQQLQEEILEDDLPLPELPNLDSLQQKIAKLKELEKTLSASKKTMSKWILLLIIFLSEYVVYKKNGLTGLIILNAILAIAYYKKEAILQHYDLWEKYFLIIGYVIGNVLAYSVPEQEKYKWPSVIGFNTILLGIYGCTYFQQKGIKQAITKLQEEIIKESETKQEELNQLEQKKQEEYLVEQQEIIKTLEEIAKNPVDSTVNVDKLETKWPGIKKEYERVKEWFKNLVPQSKEEKDLANELTEILTKIKLDKENKSLLLAFASSLSKQQFLVLVKRVPQLKDIEVEQHYANLNNEQKLQLLELSLKHLNLNSRESKRNLIAIRQQKINEEKNFDLTVEEKENLLTFFIDGLQLTQEQKKDLEEMGVSFVNASNWKITNQQKENFLKLGLEKIKFTQKQKQELFTTSLNSYKLNPYHKQIINSLSPLVKEFKYSSQLLAEIKQLNSPHNSLNILVNENIVPNPNTDFNKTTTPYLALKNYFLAQKQQEFQREILTQQKQLTKQEQAEKSKFLLSTLLEFGLKNVGKLTDLYLRLDSEYFTEKKDWVNQGAIKAWQRPYFFLNGFKLIPKYNYFELLIFAGKLLKKVIEDYLPFELEEDWDNYLTSLENKNKDKGKQKETISSLTSLTITPTEEKPNPLEEFLTLSPEEIERQRKRQVRAEQKKKLEEAEKIRREARLKEKEQRMTEEQERMRQEAELIAQEEERKRQEEELRIQRLREQQASYLAEKMRQIEGQRQRIEEQLATKQKEAELEEQRRKEQIARIEQANEQEQERLKKQAQLIEEEAQKRLEAIALEDIEERQAIKKRLNEEKARIEAEIKEKERTNQAEIAKKKLAAEQEQAEKRLEVEKLRQEIELNRTYAEETKRLGKEQEELTVEKAKLENFRSFIIRAVLDFYLLPEEGEAKWTRNPNLTKSITLKQLLESYPNVEFNLTEVSKSSILEHRWKYYTKNLKSFHRIVGNKYVTLNQFKQLVEEKVKSLDFLD